MAAPLLRARRHRAPARRVDARQARRRRRRHVSPDHADGHLPDGSDPRNPLGIPPQGPNPQGMSCPTTSLFHVGPGSPAPGGGVVAVIAIHPSVHEKQRRRLRRIRRAFRVRVAERDPSRRRPDRDIAREASRPQPMSTGHVIAVTAFLRTRGTWQDAQPVAPYGGSCVGASFAFSAPYLAGDAPPPAPPTGDADHAAVPDRCVADRRADRCMDDRNASPRCPDRGSTSRTFVHIPTCAWTDSDVPAHPTALHALSAARRRRIHAVPAVRRDRHARTGRRGAGATARPPPQRGRSSTARRACRRYDPSTQTLDRTVRGEPRIRHGRRRRDHHRDRDLPDRDHRELERRPQRAHASRSPAMPATGGACSLPLGPADGWLSGPHPVDQIEPVPFAPPSPTP